MDEKYWTTTLIHNVGTITAYGTFVRTFDPRYTERAPRAFVIQQQAITAQAHD